MISKLYAHWSAHNMSVQRMLHVCAQRHMFYWWNHHLITICAKNLNTLATVHVSKCDNIKHGVHPVACATFSKHNIVKLTVSPFRMWF